MWWSWKELAVENYLVLTFFCSDAVWKNIQEKGDKWSVILLLKKI